MPSSNDRPTARDTGTGTGTGLPAGTESFRAGQQRLLWLDAGTEIRCLRGHLRLRAAWLESEGHALPCDRDLPAHAAWRSHRGQWIRLACREDADLLVRPAAPAACPDAGRIQRSPQEKHPGPRGAGCLPGTAAGWLRRLVCGLRRGRRAA